MWIFVIVVVTNRTSTLCASDAAPKLPISINCLLCPRKAFERISVIQVSASLAPFEICTYAHFADQITQINFVFCLPILQLDRFMKRIPSPRHCRRWRSLVVHYQRNLVGFPGIHGVMCIVHCVTAIWAGNIIRKICDREHLLDWPVWAFCLRISVQRRTIKMKS